MRKFAIAISGIAALGCASAANAADLPVKAPVVQAPVVMPYNWTGLYIGANLGYMWSKTTGNFAPVNPAFSWDAPYNSALGGAQIGFNWQFNQFVIGVEGSWDGFFNSSPGSTLGNGIAGPCGFPAGTQSCQAKITDVASVGGRLGWTPWSQWLLFAQGGWARANISTNGIFGNTVFSPASNRHNGWFFGGGLDYAVSPIVSIGVDYKHYEFNSADHTDPSATSNSRSVKAKADAVFARVNVKLWGPGAVFH